MANAVTLGPFDVNWGEPGLAPGAYTTLHWGPDNRYFGPNAWGDSPGTIIATAYAHGGSGRNGDYAVWVKDLSTVNTTLWEAGGIVIHSWGLYVTFANSGAYPIEGLTIFLSIISR
jgi:hypothetical protein